MDFYHPFSYLPRWQHTFTPISLPPPLPSSLPPSLPLFNLEFLNCHVRQLIYMYQFYVDKCFWLECFCTECRSWVEEVISPATCSQTENWKLNCTTFTTVLLWAKCFLPLLCVTSAAVCHHRRETTLSLNIFLRYVSELHWRRVF